MSRDRKQEHIDLALDRSMQADRSAFDAWTFDHNALPELDFDEVETHSEMLGKPLTSPLLISCMTGGTDGAFAINRRLAEAAEERGIAVGVGSQRQALEDEETAATFEMRKYAPTVPLLANLGAVQLNYGFGVDECRRAVDMIEADALVLHLNPLQEAIQPEGQLRFASLLPKMAEVVEALDVPVIAKEVGSGISPATARQLSHIGIRILDTAGTGGTSWARIEAARAKDLDLGELFADWGIPTPECIRELRELPEIDVLASGGLRHGIDVAKSLALGARWAGMAYPFLEPATQSTEAVVAKIDRIQHELRIAMFCLGARDLAALEQVQVRRRQE
ncbi:MAG: type 2 isopentenyl-diphosphate Delta-isomerase [Acidobacteriota bacterium]